MHPKQVKGDTKLVEVVDMQEGRAVIQRDFRKLEWANRNPMKFSKKKGRKQLCREDLGILMGSKLDRTRQHDLVATKANCRLGCVSKNVASRLRKGVFLLRSALLRLWTPIQERPKNWREHSQGPARWLGLEHVTYQERL